MKIDGIGGRRPRKERIKQSMDVVKFMAGEDIGKPKGRPKGIKEYKPRNRNEDKLRGDIINSLRNNGWKVVRVEPFQKGKFGLGDLWCANEWRKWAGWMEVKHGNTPLNEDQKEIQRLCKICNQNYVVVRSIEEAINVGKK